MKALSLTQPWASAIILGVKKIETRSWSTSYRGTIAIHAAKTFPKWARDFALAEVAVRHLPAYKFPTGALIGLATLEDILATDTVVKAISDIERLYGDYSYGRFGWLLSNVKVLPEPIPCKGALGLWDVPEEIASKLR